MAMFETHKSATVGALVAMIILSPSAPMAEEDLWEYLPGITSGILADKGQRLVTSSGLSWPDGSQAVVTFWQEKRGQYVRCITYFDKSMAYTGDKCERGKKPKAAKNKSKKVLGAALPEKKPTKKGQQ